MKNNYIHLIPSNPSFAPQVADYYSRNKDFLKAFEPERNEEFYSPEYQKNTLEQEQAACEAKTAFVFISFQSRSLPKS